MSKTFRTYNAAWHTVRGSIRRTVQETRRRILAELPDGWTAGPAAFDNADQYGYAFAVHGPDNRIVDYRYSLTDSVDYDGETEPWQGVNVDATICMEDGEELGHYCPHNYTPQVWTRDTAELTHRANLTGLAEDAADKILDAISPDRIKVTHYTAPQDKLTAECWMIQIQGLTACAECQYRDTPECGGKELRRKMLAGKAKPVGRKVKTTRHASLPEALTAN